MRRNIWSVLTPAALWNPWKLLGAKKEDQDSLGEDCEYSGYFQPGPVQLSKCYSQVPGLGSCTRSVRVNAGVMHGSHEENACPSGVSCLPYPFYPYNKAEVGMSWDSPTNYSGLYHCTLLAKRTRHILGEQVLWKARACISLCRGHSELLSCFSSSHRVLVLCSSCRIHQVPQGL